MKKLLRTLLCFVLVLTLPVMYMGCLADSAKDYSGYVKYVSLGDSIADGIGLPANPLRGPDQSDKSLVYCNKTPGAYPVLVAEALGIADENFSQLACAGMRTVELRACLDPNYVIPDQYANNFEGDELTKYCTSRFDYRALIADADIVSMNMCANDVASLALFYIRNAMAANGVSEEELDSISGEAEEDCLFFEAIAKLLEYAQTAEYYAAVVDAAIQGLSVGYTRWTENWDAICGIIYQLNPDVTLVCVGMFNPFNEVKLTQKSLLTFGAALDGIVEAINAWSKAGSAYADKYIYVDIMGIESMFGENGKALTDDGFLDNMELNVHPSVLGQQQICAKVMQAVPEKNAVTGTPAAQQTTADKVSAVVKSAVGSVSRTVTRCISTIVGWRK